MYPLVTAVLNETCFSLIDPVLLALTGGCGGACQNLRTLALTRRADTVHDAGSTARNRG